MPKLSRVLATAAAISITCLASRSGFAHQQWLMPNAFVTHSDEEEVWISFEHALGDQRFISSLGPGPALLWVTAPDGKRSPPSSVFTGKTRTVAELKLGAPGTYRLEAHEPESFWTKVKEGDETRWLPQSRDRVEGQKIEVSKRYWSKSIAYVTFRKPSQGSLAPRGEPLELIPEDHPNALVAGRPFGVRVSSKGAPLTGKKIKVFSEAEEGHDPTFEVTSGEGGRAKLMLPDAGRHLISVSHEVPAPKDPRADSYFYSVYLMVEVGPKKEAKASR
ncbi:MAG: DUF4198 domain-containing protein [Myxococcota bacterium]